MKERPILMHARSINGILEGRKTQTRRIVKPQPQPNGGVGRQPIVPYLTSIGTWTWVLKDTGHGNGTSGAPCPYGQPGDRLWVRESGWMDRSEKRFFAYKSTPGICKVSDTGEFIETLPGKVTAESMKTCYKPVPSIHMPRWASRLTLEITGIRVERVQDITPEDCLAEGVQTESDYQSLKTLFAELWDDTNGKDAWDRNDWCWCIDFKRIEN